MCIYISDTVILSLLFLSGFVGGLFIQWLIMQPAPPPINLRTHNQGVMPRPSKTPMPLPKKPKK